MRPELRGRKARVALPREPEKGALVSSHHRMKKSGLQCAFCLWGKGIRYSSDKEQKSGSGKNTTFKIRLRGQDGCRCRCRNYSRIVRSCPEIEASQNYRAKWATLYLTIVDEHS